MSTARNLVIGVVALSVLVFIALFGRLPALRNSPVGFLHRVLCIHAPRGVYRADVALTGGRVAKSGARFGNYLLFERHPLVLIFFLAVLTGAAGLFLYPAWPLLSTPHRAPIPPLLGTVYLATYLCASSDASTITRLTHGAHLRVYPYDHTLYHPRIPCRTCGFAKPARSKHCSVCGVCVARADHHCAWVNNCIGRANHGYFILLLASLSGTLVYGAYLAGVLLAPRVATPAADDGASFIGTLRVRLRLWFAAASRDPALGGVGLLALLTAPLAAGLLAYHMYLIYAGTTTNETSKWSALSDSICEGRAYRGSRSIVLPPDRQTTGLAAQAHGQQWAAPPLTPVFEADEEQVAGWRAEASSSAAVADAARRWPATSDQIVVRTRDGKPPVFAGRRGGEAAGWEQVWRLEQVVNLYDLGFWANLREVLFPPALPFDY